MEVCIFTVVNRLTVLSITISFMFNRNVLCSRGEALEGSDSEEDDDVGEFPGRREVITFLNWLIFCDKVSGAICKIIAVQMYFGILIEEKGGV